MALTPQERIAQLEQALPPADRLRLLADWFDREQEAHRPDWHEHTVQSDMRAWADRIDRVNGTEKGQS